MIRVVVVNWNAADLTSRCLRSLDATQWPSDDLDIVVVDNGSIDGSLDVLRRRHRSVRFIENLANLGFAEGCNRALTDLDDVEFVALVNNDAVVEPGWLEPLVRTMRTDDAIGAVSPKIVLDREFQSIDIEVGGSGPRARLTAVTVDGIDSWASVLCGEGVSRPPHPSVPLRLEIEVASVGEIAVPVFASPPTIRLTFASERPVTVRSGESAASADPIDGEVRLVVAPTGPPERRINSLGTALTRWCEGYERCLGDIDRDDIEVETVAGWTGGGVLLRTAMLDDVGRFDPTFFMYYEDTDLSWRMRRAGWITRTCPESVIRHRLGATAGSSWPGFFYLNYRNWLLTVARNGSPNQLRRALAAAWRNSWPFARRNVVGTLRRGRRPDTDISGRWLRILLGTAAALPRTLGARPHRTGRLIGRSPVDAVGSAFLTLSDPASPRVEPDGPTLVYVDVTDTLASRWRAGIQRVVTEVVGRLILDHPELTVVPMRWSSIDQAYRRLDMGEMESFFEPAPMPNHPPDTTPPRRSMLRKVAGRVAAIPPVRRRIDDRRRAQAAKHRPAHHPALLIDRFDAGSVLFDIDAVWNLDDIPRRDMYPTLRAAGVRIVTVLHDVLPVTDPQWFDPSLAAVFGAHVDAAVDHADAVVTSSEFSSSALGSMASAAERDDLAIHAVTLGSDPTTTLVDSLDEALLSSLADRRIILVVGTLEPRKNHSGLLDAFDALDTEASLVIVGRQGWKIDALATRIRRHRHFGSRLLWPSEVSDATLAALYGAATVVAVPSFAEGFGLPVVEALRHGCRVVSSDGGSLREVGVNGVTFVDPTDVGSFARALDEALTDDSPRVRPDGLPTWDDAANAVADILRGADAGR